MSECYKTPSSTNRTVVKFCILVTWGIFVMCHFNIVHSCPIQAYDAAILQVPGKGCPHPFGWRSDVWSPSSIASQICHAQCYSCASPNVILGVQSFKSIQQQATVTHWKNSHAGWRTWLQVCTGLCCDHAHSKRECHFYADVYWFAMLTCLQNRWYSYYLCYMRT